VEYPTFDVPTRPSTFLAFRSDDSQSPTEPLKTETPVTETEHTS